MLLHPQKVISKSGGVFSICSLAKKTKTKIYKKYCTAIDPKKNKKKQIKVQKNNTKVFHQKRTRAHRRSVKSSL